MQFPDMMNPNRAAMPESSLYIEIIFDIPLNQTFTYLIDEKGEAAVGKRVMSPFGKRELLGYVIATKDYPPEDVPPDKMKKIRRVVDQEAIFDEEEINLAKWMSSFYLCSVGEALAAMIPSGRKVHEGGMFTEDENEISPTILDLSCEQENALQAIINGHDNEKKNAGPPSMFYLYGITGSGKTEVFLRAAEYMLQQGKSVIYLVPEISLTHQTAEAINKRFGSVASTIHSGMSPAARFNEWVNIRRGNISIVVGPRSAVFTPLRNLGLIIIDEEHDGSYKSGNSPRYHARQVAMRRCSMSGAALVMGSATPSAEAWKLMNEGTIKRLDLTRRLSGGTLPEIVPVNLSGSDGVLSPLLKEEIHKTAQEGKQTILFLNRRGFAYFYHCNSCGYELRCRNCSVSLTYHKSKGRAVCHYCSYSEIPPKSCPECGSLEAGFTGFGTENIEEEVQRTFPDLRIRRADADTTSKKGSLREILEMFRQGLFDILLGTQMVSKGLNFPGVRLVGVVLADTGLHLPDFRAAERTFSHIVQAAGRAGRYAPDGKVIVQTFRPHDPAITYACNMDIPGFFETELKQREILGFPPYARIIRFTSRSKDSAKADNAIHRLASILKNILPADTDMLGPSECPINIIAGNHRRHIILRGKSMGNLHWAARTALDRYEEQKDNRVYIEIDVDPVSLL
jgi:primosomal protein N' (replication factor Y)